MRNVDQEDSYGQGRPLGEGALTGDGGSSTATGSDPSGPRDGGRDPGLGTDDPYGPGSDTVGLDDALADLDDDEVEDAVMDVLEDIYGSDAEQMFDDLQSSTGLSPREILDILLGVFDDDSGSSSFGAGETATSGFAGSASEPAAGLEVGDDWYDDPGLFETGPGFGAEETDLDASILPDGGSEGSFTLDVEEATTDILTDNDMPEVG